MTTTVRPRTPAELAVLVPYQLGYHPRSSLILTAVDGRRLGLLQRHDLTADPDHCPQIARDAVAILEREDATAVVVMAFEEEDGSSAPLREAVLAEAETNGLTVREHLVVRDGRWFAPDCREACCPEDGLPLPCPEDVPAVAAFVHAGVAPWRSREQLVEEVLPEPDEERAGRILVRVQLLLDLAVATGTLAERGPRLADDWRAILDPDPSALPVADLGDALLARAAVSLEDVHWRDVLMGGLCPGTFPVRVDELPETTEVARGATDRCPWATAAGPDDHADEVLAVRTRLVELVRLLPVGLTPPALTLVAHLAWWCGDGTVAAIALRRALEVDPSYRLAGLMEQLLMHGVRPWDATSTSAMVGRRS